ncbi:MAG: type II secretion system protein [Ruminiclostridium sp.]|nr:type II secretion system protein [Ruminiclostridium sp.]
MRKLHNQKGMTLTELVIAMVLLGIVLAIGYNFIHYINKSYSESEKKWIAQTNARQVSEFITSELKTSFYAEIDYSGDMSEGDSQLYLVDGKLMQEKSDTEPTQITDGLYSITFEKAKKNTWTEGSEGNERINNTITYTIEALDTDGATPLYTLQSTVFLENMIEGRAITGHWEGSTIRYQRTSPESPMPTDVSRCFIATAAYDSPDDTSVMLLRRFRDEVLLTNAVGRTFVDFYYRVSPPIAEYISQSELLKYIVRAFLTPIVGFASVFVCPEMMILCLALILLRIYIRFPSQGRGPRSLGSFKL